MFWQHSKAVRSEIVEYLNRVFISTPKWYNTGLDIVQLPADVGPTTKRLAIEAFAYEGEKYPVITVSTAGERQTDEGFNGFIGTFRPESQIGQSGNGLITVGPGQVAQQILSDAILAKGVFVDVYQIGYAPDTLYAGVGYRDPNSGLIVLTATGSIEPYDKQNKWQNCYIPFNATGSVQPGSIPQVFELWSAAGFYLMSDNTTSIGGSSIVSDPTVYGTPTQPDIVCQVVGAPYNRTGGLEEITLNFRCASVNDEKVAQDISDLLKIYLKLARTQTVDVDFADSLSIFDPGTYNLAVGELHGKGIYVDTVTTGPDGQRRRGDNDIVYEKVVTCLVRTEWGRDSEVPELSDVEVDMRRSFPGNVGS